MRGQIRVADRTGSQHHVVDIRECDGHDARVCRAEIRPAVPTADGTARIPGARTDRIADLNRRVQDTQHESERPGIRAVRVAFVVAVVVDDVRQADILRGLVARGHAEHEQRCCNESRGSSSHLHWPPGCASTARHDCSRLLHRPRRKRCLPPNDGDARRWRDGVVPVRDADRRAAGSFREKRQAADMNHIRVGVLTTTEPLFCSVAPLNTATIDVVSPTVRVDLPRVAVRVCEPGLDPVGLPLSLPSSLSGCARPPHPRHSATAAAARTRAVPRNI